MTVRVTAASRLHFGLVHVPVPGETAARAFGGLGLMIDAPGVTVTAEPAASWSFEGSLAARAKTFCERINPKTPFAVTADGPPEHVGLGVGTALGLAVASALMSQLGRQLKPEDLAVLAGRGERSGVGVHGFGHGGLVIDRGKAPGAVTAECISHPFPAAWRVLLIRPAAAATWHGAAERAAFAHPRPGHSERLLALRDNSFAFAVISGDFDEFAEALYEYNRLAGEPFAADQGGTYAGPAVTRVVETLHSWGVKGVGQSSWGPTCFAFAKSAEDVFALKERVEREWDDGTDVCVAAAAGPAKVKIS